MYDICIGGHDIDFNKEMVETEMLDDEHDCIPAAWEGYECADHPIIIGKGDYASGDG